MCDAAIVAITETWLCASLDSYAYTCRNFSNFVGHKANKSGGGVMCLNRLGYKAIAMPLPDSFPQSCEGLIIKINSLASVIFLIYRLPDCNTADTLSLWSTIESVLETGFNTTVKGDLNQPNIDWCSDPPKASCALGKLVLEIVTAWDMSQLVLQPTRKANILDIILTTAPSAHGKCHVEPPVPTSDHCTVVCAITASPRVKFATKPVCLFLNFR